MGNRFNHIYSINPDALATGFEERNSIVSEQMRALNHVRIVVMEIHVARCGLCQFRMLWLEPWEGHLWFDLTLYFVTSLLMPPFLRYYFVYESLRLPVTCQFRDINCLKEIV